MLLRCSVRCPGVVLRACAWAVRVMMRPHAVTMTKLSLSLTLNCVLAVYFPPLLPSVLVSAFLFWRLLRSVLVAVSSSAFAGPGGLKVFHIVLQTDAVVVVVDIRRRRRRCCRCCLGLVITSLVASLV